MSPRSLFASLSLTLLALSLGGCETSTLGKPNQPPRLLFLQAEALENEGTYSEALTNYQKIVDENPGTLLATYAHLKIAEVKFVQEEWVEAETEYRLFLNLNPTTHLTPYVLHRLLIANHRKSFTGVIFKEREVDRDMAPNRQIILEFKRFFLLYPKSVYLEEVRPMYAAARETLARYELVVGDYYFDKEQYNAAIGRYRYLLRNFPDYKNQRGVLTKLIRAYRENQQPVLQQEMERIYQIRFGVGVPGGVGEKAVSLAAPRARAPGEAAWAAPAP